MRFFLGVLLAGVVALYVGDSGSSDGSLDFTVDLGPNIALGTVGAIFTVGGLIGVGISSKRLRDAKHQLAQYQAGTAATPVPPEPHERHSLAELEARKRRAMFGLLAPGGLMLAGVGPLVAGYKADDCETSYGRLT